MQCREVTHCVDSASFERNFEAITVAKVDRHNLGIWMNRASVSPIEIVQRDHLVPCGNKFLHRDTSDVPARTSYQYSHVASVAIRWDRIRGSPTGRFNGSSWYNLVVLTTRIQAGGTPLALTSAPRFNPQEYSDHAEW
jgi:hypothetical protein